MHREPDRGLRAHISDGPGVVGECRIRSREQYQDFLKCLNLFAQDIIAKGELQIMVQDILGRYPDLLVGLPASRILRRSWLVLHGCSDAWHVRRSLLGRRPLRTRACRAA